MTSWHTGMFSSLERWTSRDQRQQVGSLESAWDEFHPCERVSDNARRAASPLLCTSECRGCFNQFLGSTAIAASIALVHVFGGCA
jgi:hypothetical protein